MHGRPAAPSGPSRRFTVKLAVIAAVALAVRVAYVLAVVRHRPLGLDAQSYRDLALHVRGGDGYAQTTPDGRLVATATFPPGYPAFLAAVSLVVGRTVLGWR